jgi:type IV pilus assembly protein PilW
MVELMVAVTLAMLVSAGVISVFIGSRTAYQATSGTADLTDGGRFALGFISNAVRGAGYMSCTTAPRVQGILNAGANSLPFGFGEALGGFEANNTGNPSAYALAAASTTAPVPPDLNVADWVGNLDPALAGLPVANNDVLVVRSTLRNAQTSYVSNIVTGSASFTVNNQNSLLNGQIAVISDCYSAVVFQITALGPLGANAVVTHNVGGSPGNSTSSFGTLSFAPGAQVTPVDTQVFYIGQGADGDGALFVYDLNGTGAFTASELVPDIEAMQILYGVDTTGTQTASKYVTADQVLDFNTVMSVKVALLAASAPGLAKQSVAGTYNLLGAVVTAPIDSRSRQVFEETIAVRNALP